MGALFDPRQLDLVEERVFNLPTIHPWNTRRDDPPSGHKHRLILLGTDFQTGARCQFQNHINQLIVPSIYKVDR